MLLQGLTLADALKGSDCNDLLLTTFTLDEVELYSLSQHLDLANRRAIVRFDQAGFRSWAHSRIVSPTWLRPFRPGKASPPGRVPPIFHPKIALARNKGKSARLVVSTGNLASSDQREMSNLLCVVQIGMEAAEKIRRCWGRQKEPNNRNLCVLANGTAKATVELSASPAWTGFRQLIREFQCETQDWILASPFWSQQVARRFSATGIARSVHAYFRDTDSARAYAPSLRALTVSGTLKAWVPKRGQSRNGMHHKVIAWRGTRGSTTQVLVYIGSANLTEAGFLGVESPGVNGKKSPVTEAAWNWEAGVLYVGDGKLWPVAQAAAHAGMAWREVQVPKKQKRLPSKIGVEIDIDALLRVHLRGAFAYTRTKMQRRQCPEIPGTRLARMDMWDGDRHIAQNVRIGDKVTLPPSPNCLAVRGTYNVANSLRDVEIELAELSPHPADLDASTTVLADLLRSIGSPAGSKKKGKLAPATNSSDEGGQRLPSDVRFPYSSYYEAKEKDADAALRWLVRVQRIAGKGDVPKFWATVARCLR